MIDFARLQELFDQVCELPPTLQAEFLDSNCSGDEELHAELIALLRADRAIQELSAR